MPGEPHEQRSLAGYNPWGRRVRHDLSDLAHIKPHKDIGNLKCILRSTKSLKKRYAACFYLYDITEKALLCENTVKESVASKSLEGVEMDE